MNTVLPDFDSLIARAREETKPFRWVIQQAHCRACGSVHETQPVLMLEHAPGSFILCASQEGHDCAPVRIQTIQLAWCRDCKSAAAAELTRDVRAAIDAFANTTTLEKELKRVMAKYELAHQREKFHHL
jgi:hypothetical protein